MKGPPIPGDIACNHSQGQGSEVQPGQPHEHAALGLTTQPDPDTSVPPTTVDGPLVFTARHLTTLKRGANVSNMGKGEISREKSRRIPGLLLERICQGFWLVNLTNILHAPVCT